MLLAGCCGGKKGNTDIAVDDGSTLKMNKIVDDEAKEHDEIKVNGWWIMVNFHNSNQW